MFKVKFLYSFKFISMHRRLRKPNENPQVANNSDNIEIFESRRANIQESMIEC